MLREEIVAYMDAFVASFAPPLLEGVTVRHLRSDAQHGFMLDATDGIHFADQVVVATGGYQIPIVPRCAERLPADIVQIHSSLYRNPGALPDGAVLVVGSGQSGCQIAEDLHLAGRKVHLCVGDAPRVARRYRGKDVVEWLDLMGYYDLPVHEHPLGEGVRDKTNHYVTGRDGGRDIDLRQRALRRHGTLWPPAGRHGRSLGLRRRSRALPRPGRSGFRKHQDQHRRLHRQKGDRGAGRATLSAGLESKPGTAAARLSCSRHHIHRLVHRLSHRLRWIDLPLFNGRGQPSHVRGVTPVPGAYFLGLPWLYTWGSGRFSGISRDAEYLAEHIKARRGSAGADRRQAMVNEAAIGS